MYKVIKDFFDLQDAKETKSGTVYTKYNAGDTYPRKGLKPSEKRIEELLSSNNKRGIKLIEKVDEPEPVAEPVEEEEPVAEPEKKPRKKPTK